MGVSAGNASHRLCRRGIRVLDCRLGEGFIGTAVRVLVGVLMGVSVGVPVGPGY